MARLSSTSQLAPSASPEKGAAELSQLLHRLDQTILHADQDRERRLRASEFERARLNSVWPPFYTKFRQKTLANTLFIAESRVCAEPPHESRTGDAARQASHPTAGYASRPEPETGTTGAPCG